MKELSEVIYKVKTHPWVARFASEYRFPGWYIDTNGCYGCLLSKYWISVFVNDYDKTLDITVDTIGRCGIGCNSTQVNVSVRRKMLKTNLGGGWLWIGHFVLIVSIAEINIVSQSQIA